MAQSQNTKVEYTEKATSMMGLATYGDVMIGDAAFEFYNEKNPEDFIQIPWDEGDYKGERPLHLQHARQQGDAARDAWACARGQAAEEPQRSRCYEGRCAESVASGPLARLVL